MLLFVCCFSGKLLYSTLVHEVEAVENLCNASLQDGFFNFTVDSWNLHHVQIV